MRHDPRQSLWKRPAGIVVRTSSNRSRCGLAACTTVCCLAFAAGNIVQAQTPIAPQGLLVRAQGQSAAGRMPAAVDVALRADGVLAGRVLALGQDAWRHGVPGAGIVLRSQSRVVAQTAADADGRFSVPALSGGVYELFASTPQGVCSRICRLWSASAAPPSAVAEIELVDDGQSGLLVRGQSPFPTATIGRVATVTGIIAGAIAVPVIYSTKNTQWIPASP